MLSRIIDQGEASFAKPFPLEIVSRPLEQQRQSTPSDSHVMAQAERIAQLECTLAEVEKAAYERGYRDADAACREKYSASMQSTAERLASALSQLSAIRPKLYKEAETDLLRLSLAIARRVLYRELTVDPSALHALVQVSLDRLGRQEEIRARVSAALADAVRSSIAKLTSRNIEIVPDASLEAGSLIFETSRGRLDASINSQLDEIERGLIDRLDRRD